MISYDISKSKLLILAIFLVILSFIISWIYYIIRFYFGFEYAMGMYPIIDIFDLDEEKTIPVWLGSSLLLIAGLLSFFLSKQDVVENKKYWLGICILLVFLSLDEASMVHERTEILAISMVSITFFLSGDIGYFRFLSRINRRVTYYLVFAAIFFVVGSIFIDSINFPYIQEHGRDNIAYRGLATLEEGFEFTGIFLFLQGLIQQLSIISRHGITSDALR